MIGMLTALMTVLSASPSSDTGGGEPIEVPPPAQAYFDPDSSARMPIAVDLFDARAIRELNRRIAREPKQLGLYTARGHAYGFAGNRAAMEKDFEQAFALAGSDRAALRHVSWSQGWAYFGLGDARAALASFTSATQLHGGAPFWVPYTYAVALWRLDRRQEALRYWDAAARSAPERWGNAKVVQRWTRRWPAGNQAEVVALFEAWKIAHGTPPEPHPH
jgi:tetratricopeptide (TPR) repeat protein